VTTQTDGRNIRGMAKNAYLRYSRFTEISFEPRNAASGSSQTAVILKKQAKIKKERHNISPFFVCNF